MNNPTFGDEPCAYAETISGASAAGRCKGGHDGVRRVRLLKRMTASIPSNGRIMAAFGVAVGAPGALGIYRVELPTAAWRLRPTSARPRWSRARCS